MMDINIDNETKVMHWENKNVKYEYRIDSTGRAFAYLSGNRIFIEIYSEGHSSHRVISVNGEDVIWYDDLGNVNLFSNLPVKLHFSNFCDLCLSSSDFFVMTDSQVIKINSMGKELFKLSSPFGYKFSRFINSSPLSVICEQITDNSDKYGRNDWKFEFDSILFEWKKISIIQ